MLLERLAEGNSTARELLLVHATDRMRLLARKMLRDYPGVQRWEQTDDVVQNVLLRLNRALHDIRPVTVRCFLQLAALQVRRECIDLVRHYFGPHGLGANYATPAEAWSVRTRLPDQPDLSGLPDLLASWSEFHSQIDALDPSERELFDLLWYQGLPQEGAADLLGVSLSTLKRRWQAARVRLYEALGGELPI